MTRIVLASFNFKAVIKLVTQCSSPIAARNASQDDITEAWVDHKTRLLIGLQGVFWRHILGNIWAKQSLASERGSGSGTCYWEEALRDLIKTAANKTRIARKWNVLDKLGWYLINHFRTTEGFDFLNSGKEPGLISQTAVITLVFYTCIQITLQFWLLFLSFRTLPPPPSHLKALLYIKLFLLLATLSSRLVFLVSLILSLI